MSAPVRVLGTVSLPVAGVTLRSLARNAATSTSPVEVSMAMGLREIQQCRRRLLLGLSSYQKCLNNAFIVENLSFTGPLRSPFDTSTAQIPAITCQFRWPPPPLPLLRAEHCNTAIWVKIRMILCRNDDNVYPCFQEIGHNQTTIFWNSIVRHKNTQDSWACEGYK